MEHDMKMVNELIRLKTENPELKVCVISEPELFGEDDDYAWYEGEISKVEIGDYYRDEDRILTCEEDLIDHIESYHDVSPEDGEAYDKIFKSIFHKKVIYIRVGISS
jgi:hypothetical protein